jgi:hypothetical protein
MKNISCLFIIFFLMIVYAGIAQSTYRIKYQPENINLLKAKPLKNSDCIIASNDTNSLLTFTRVGSSGEVLWSYTYPLLANNFYIDFYGTNDNGFIVLARLDSANKSAALLIFKCDRNGQLQWQKQIWPENKSSIYPELIIQTKDGGYYFVCINNDLTYLNKLDGNGNVVWRSVFDPDNSDSYIIEALSESEDGGALIMVSNEACEFYCRTLSLYKFERTGNPGERLNFSFYFDNFIINSYVSYMNQDMQKKFSIMFNGSMYGIHEQNYYFLTIPDNKVQTNALTINNDIFSLQYFIRERKINLKPGKMFFQSDYYLNKDFSIIETYPDYQNDGKVYLRTDKYDSLGRKCRDYTLPVFDTNFSTTNITFTRASFELKEAAVFLYNEGNLLPPSPVNYAHLVCRGDAVLQSIKSGTAVQDNTTISLYPNPAHNYINVNMQRAESTVMLQILKPDGTILKKITLSYTGESMRSINISDLQKGIYFLKLDMRNEQQLFKFSKD